MTTDIIEQLYKAWSDLNDLKVEYEQAKDPRFEETKQKEYKAFRKWYDMYLSSLKHKRQPVKE